MEIASLRSQRQKVAGAVISLLGIAGLSHRCEEQSDAAISGNSPGDMAIRSSRRTEQSAEQPLAAVLRFLICVNL